MYQSQTYSTNLKKGSQPQPLFLQTSIFNMESLLSALKLLLRSIYVNYAYQLERFVFVYLILLILKIWICYFVRSLGSSMNDVIPFIIIRKQIKFHATFLTKKSHKFIILLKMSALLDILSYNFQQYFKFSFVHFCYLFLRTEKI